MLLLDDKNHIYSFGENFFGQLGLGDENDRNIPELLTKIPKESEKIIKIACGGNHTLLLDDKNQIYSFGENSCGQLGLGDKNSRNLPELLTKIPKESGKIIKIACGEIHTLLLDNKNQI